MGRIDHKLIDIIVIAICAVICGVTEWKQMAAFGVLRKKWFEEFLELPHGIPSSYTFRRVFNLISPEAFQQCFIEWSKQVSKISTGEIVAIDGKTLRNSHHKVKGKEALHIVNAFATSNGITLGAIKVPDKSNEIKGIPKLLNILKLTGCIVTIDAIGTQKGIAKLIRMKGAHYVLALKKNQGKLFKKVASIFENAEKIGYQNIIFKRDETFEYDHSRIERRTYNILPMMYSHCFKDQWKDINTFIEVKSAIETSEGTTESARYYISSLPLKNYKKISESIRRHWSIENKLHWKLDVAMAEDGCRIYKANGAENFSALRKLALFYLEKDTDTKGGVQFKQFLAAQDPLYLPKLLKMQ